MDHAGLSASQTDRISRPNLVQELRLKCFVVADRYVNRFVRFLTLIHEGFWLGWLSPDDLNALTAGHFDQSQFFSSNVHNRSGFFEWEREMLDRFFTQGSRVLVAGAGGGREVLALRRSGFAAEGFDCNRVLVKASERLFDELGESRHVIYCPPDTVPPGSPTFDALVVGWTVYTHIPTKQRRIRFLEALRKRALENAPLLISFFARVSSSRQDALSHRLARFWSFFSRARKDAVEIGDHINYARYTHSFTEQELSEELLAAGFRITHFFEAGGFGYSVAIAEEVAEEP